MGEDFDANGEEIGCEWAAILGVRFVVVGIQLLVHLMVSAAEVARLDRNRVQDRKMPLRLTSFPP